jgi:hypothetical protein
MLAPVRIVVHLVVAASLGACSGNHIPDTSDGAAQESTTSCSPNCNSGQLCFAPAPPDAGPPASCQLVPSACASNPSCACLGPNLCADGYDYCNYDELVGYFVLQCSN